LVKLLIEESSLVGYVIYIICCGVDLPFRALIVKRKKAKKEALIPNIANNYRKSGLYATVDGDDAVGQIRHLRPYESGPGYPAGEFALGGKFTDAFNQILIAGMIAGYGLTEAGNDVE
jgi:hypothetical protein